MNRFGPIRGVLLLGLVSACAAPSTPPNAPNAPNAGTKPAVSTADPPASQALAPTASVKPPPRRPWWTDMPADVYHLAGAPIVYGVGRSSEHHHPAEGFLRAKVRARLAVRRAAGTVAFRGPMPEPMLQDLFIDATGTFWALYRLDVPVGASAPPNRQPWRAPHPLRTGRGRVGRHLFEGGRHLFLECDVEGPIANPDWGQTRASAWYTRPVRNEP